MNIECLFILVIKLFNIMNMNKTVDRGGNDVFEVIVVLNFGDPGPVNYFLNVGNAFVLFFVFNYFLFKSFIGVRLGGVL
jgi:hypothetical protein